MYLSPSTTNPSDFSSEQALLRDLAFQYGDGSNEQSNGPSTDFQAMDDEDPAALLECLASLSEITANHEPCHFASLLEAAASAGGAEAAQQDRNEVPPLLRSNQNLDIFKRSFIPDSNLKRNLESISPAKRQRTLEPEAEAEAEAGAEECGKQIAAVEREIWGSDDGEEDDYDATFMYERPPNATKNARELGIYSVAALFRRPSAASKKYTRPPMSKLFTSLQITPEQFLHLQGAAKSYMLDPSYPERRDCVGSKAKGDTDMVKLKLFACVEFFLVHEEWGEMCWGVNSIGHDQRDLHWPEMRNRITTLVTPLLRRMVTNERQRTYATSARKARALTKPKPTQNSGDHRAPPSQKFAESPNPQPAQGQPSFYQTELDSIKSPTPQYSTIPLTPQTPSEEEAGIRFHINLVRPGCSSRIKPKHILASTTCPGFESLLHNIQSLLKNESLKLSRIKALGVDGLVEVTDEQGWKSIIQSIEGNEWMDGELKMTVEVEDMTPETNFSFA